VSAVRVLLADDDALMRAGVAVVLGSAGGIDVVGQAADGLETVQACRSLEPDVVLMDVRMPGIDGIEATRRIRALPAPAGRIPIIGVSGRTEPRDAAAAMAAGMNAYLRKPASPAELNEALRMAARINRA
jgi:DNA-binding NarL/FixJ family response regulator